MSDFESWKDSTKYYPHAFNCTTRDAWYHQQRKIDEKDAELSAERERLDWWQENPDVEIFADKRYPGGPWVALFTRTGEEVDRRVFTAATLRGVIKAAMQATDQESKS